MSCKYPLTLGLMMVAVFGWSAAQTSGQRGELAVVRLVVKVESGILISRLNPPSIKLVNPFDTGKVLTARIDGVLSRERPEFYYARLKPVTWSLLVPDSVASGSYPAEVRAIFSLCSTARGFCYTDQQKALATVQVGEQQEDTTVVFQLRQPEW